MTEITVVRRGKGPELLPLLDGRPHVAAHSYGVLGTLLAATGRPDSVRSLTLIEPPPFSPVPDDPAIARLARLGEEVLTHGLDTDPANLREFLRLTGASGVDEEPLPQELVFGVRPASPRASNGFWVRFAETRGHIVLPYEGIHLPFLKR